MSPTFQEGVVFFGGIALFFLSLFGLGTCEDRAVAEKMKACAAMCAGALAEYRDGECKCRPKQSGGEP